MSLTCTPLHPVLGAQAHGIDLTQPLSAQQVSAINAAMNQYAVLVFRGQALTASQQIHWMSHFGEIDIGLKRVFKRTERLGDERLIDISNVNAQGQVDRRDSPKNLSNFANQLWHSDSSFMKPRAAYSLLHCLITPSWGGNTEFADLRHAYDTLDERTRRDAEGLQAEHYALHTRLLLGDEAYTDEQKRHWLPWSGRWWTRTRAQVASCCLWARMPGKSSAGPLPRVACSCRICWNMPPSTTTCMHMNGNRGTR